MRAPQERGTKESKNIKWLANIIIDMYKAPEIHIDELMAYGNNKKREKKDDGNAGKCRIATNTETHI